MKPYSIVVAATRKNGIGFKGGLPWPKLKQDLAFFKDLTLRTADPAKWNAVIMGRKTWTSIGKPLTGRLNLVLTRDPEFENKVKQFENVKVFHSFPEAISSVSSDTKVDKIFIIGGAEIYAEALKGDTCNEVFLTQILKDFEFDVSIAPLNPKRWKLETESDLIVENGVPYQMLKYVKTDTKGKGEKRKRDGKNDETEKKVKPEHEELQYLQLVKEIILSGNKRGDRTGVGTLSKFGAQLRFNLDGQFPLLTTKSVFFRGVVEELLWMIKGSTDSRVLSKKGVKIWDGNSTREFLDKLGFKDREVGDLGPVYGFQWRHFGAEYKTCTDEYEGKGFDQLKDVIELIKKDPTSRRIVMSAWNPLDIPKMALPPCHILAQFYVHEGRLSCQLYQRSADMGLGVPFNIASYSLLTYLVAHVTGLKVGHFVHTFGDAHVYLNHVEPLNEQIKREPRPFPTLVLNPAVKNIDDFTAQDITLVGYKPHATIKMEMAV